MRLRNGTGAEATAPAARASRARLRWAVRLRHLPITATRADLWCDFDKRHRPARVGQQWRSLGAGCNGWIERLRAPQARGAASYY